LVVTFRDRADAGRRLAVPLARYAADKPVIEGLPRGGVPVAFEVANALHAPLDVLLVRKLGCPGQPELGVGAISEGGVRVTNRALVARLGIPDATLDDIAGREGETLARRLKLLRGDRDRVPVAGRTVIVIDDGLATGYTARAAIEVMRRLGAEKVVLAVPVAPAEAVDEMRDVADDVVCLVTPAWFMAIGEFYDDFTQVPDEQVARMLASIDRGHDQPDGPAPAVNDDVEVGVGSSSLPGRLVVPSVTSGTVLFAHGSGSSRSSPRNRAVADTLNRAGQATLLFDLLTPAESADRAKVFDVALLAERLVAATRWVQGRPRLVGRPIGYFGASTGAAAALVAAADLGSQVTAVTSRGGRPDLAGARLSEVTAPTLLIVGGDDRTVLELNRQAATHLGAMHRLEVIPGATHLFEEPGALDAVARLAAGWFDRHFAGGAPVTGAR
jgi:predicted phosphoribosyltransferase/alpha-beta hydrolase superfamily lysophospholipase